MKKNELGLRDCFVEPQLVSNELGKAIAKALQDKKDWIETIQNSKVDIDNWTTEGKKRFI